MFPAILAVGLLYFVEKYVTKVTPKPIRVFFVPMMCFIIVFPLTLLVLGPIGLTIGKVLTTIMLTLYKYVGWLAVGLVAAVLPLLISIGAHKAFILYVISSLGTMGYEILYNGASLAHNISEGGGPWPSRSRPRTPTFAPRPSPAASPRSSASPSLRSTPSPSSASACCSA